MKIENATRADIPALVQLWNAALGANWPMTPQLLRQTMQADPTYEESGNFIIREYSQGENASGEGAPIVAWLLCKSMENPPPQLARFQNMGGIGALCVHPNFQRRGLATQLLARAEEYLTARGSRLSTTYFPHHFLPGIPTDCAAALRFFRARGFEIASHESVDLKRDLSDFALPPRVLAAIEANPTVEIRPAQGGESDAIIEMVTREFPGGWPYTTAQHFARGDKASDVIIAVENGEVIGFCLTADFHSRWLLPGVYWHELLGEKYGGLGPIGIAKEHRKRGLGLALCAVAVQDLKNRGVETMAIDWTGLVDFYGALGFKVWKSYVSASKK